MGVKNIEGPNYISEMGEFQIFKNGRFLKSLYPEKRFYNSSDQVTTEAAIYSTIIGDLYIAIGDKNLVDKDKSWTTRIWFNPFTIWIWIGILFLSFGGLISLIKVVRKNNSKYFLLNFLLYLILRHFDPLIIDRLIYLLIYLQDLQSIVRYSVHHK